MKRKSMLIVIFCVALFMTKMTFSQNYQLPKIIPPSPEAQNFMRYGEIPVDHSTGVPNISIPLYEIKSRKLSLPISISYHAAGIKVSDKSSVIGLGWVLNAGGIITRSVMGFVDSSASKPSYRNGASWDSARTAANTGYSAFSNFGYYLGLEEGNRDWLSDRYYYQLPGGSSGTFYYDFISGNMVKVPYSPERIEKESSGYKITDASGTIYYYEPDSYYGLTGYPTDWTIKTIISADKTDTIRFVYKEGISNYYLNGSYVSTLSYGNYPYQVSGSITYGQSASVSTQPATGSTSDVEILDSIISASTIIKVTVEEGREDLYQGDGYKIKKLSIYDRYSGALIKEIEFSQSYFGSSENNNQRMRLDTLTFKGRNSAEIQHYSFVYESGNSMPPYPEFYQQFSEDYWGYYNGTAASSMIPQEFVPDSFTFSGFQAYQIPSNYSTNRNPNHNYAKEALIKEIHYPTGGKTVFEFEPNYAHHAYDVGNGLEDGYVGGFRIKTIKNYTDSAAVPEVKTYTYGLGETRRIEPGLFLYGQSEFYIFPCPNYVGSWRGEATRVHVLSEPLLPLSLDNGPPVFYGEVTEYMGDTTSNIGKTVFRYMYPQETIIYHDEIRQELSYEYDRGNYVPRLTGKTVYKKEEGEYLPVINIENSYSSYSDTGHQTGIHLVHTRDYPQSGYHSDPFDYDNPTDMGVDCAPSFSTDQDPNYYYFIDRRATTENIFLTRTDEYNYAPDTSKYLVNTVIYSYDTLTNLQPIQQLAISSKGDSLKTNFTYPIDYAATAAVYDSMVARNIITPVVEQSNYKNSEFLQSMKTNYYAWSSNLIAPQTVDSKTLDNNTETRLRFYAYDSKGNTLSVSKENDIKMSYLWDYNNLYPVAQVTNADTGTIAYTSFEGDGKGNWNYSSTPGADYTAPTGKKIYTLTGSNAITRSGLNSGNTYIVSYWTKNSSAYSITGTITGWPVQGRTVDGWKYFEHRVTGQSSVSINGTGTIDEVRLYPSTAQMSTFTYDPSIGTTSQCDANNRIAYYEYDYAGRLVLIRDQDKNILKQYCYNFAGQAETCSFFSSTDQSQNYYNENCSGGETPVAYYVYMPSGMFSSTISTADANAKAWQYGQEQANLYGDCQETVAINYSNWASSSCFIVEFYNPSTGYDMWFEIDNGSGVLAYVPPGTYDIHIYENYYGCDNSTYRTYHVGNSSYNGNTNGEAMFYSVTINSTYHNLSIN